MVNFPFHSRTSKHLCYRETDQHPIKPFHQATTVSAYLEIDNTSVRDAVAAVISTVQASANLSVHAIRNNRAR
jgi:hypothetical protein